MFSPKSFVLSMSLVLLCSSCGRDEVKENAMRNGNSVSTAGASSDLVDISTLGTTSGKAYPACGHSYQGDYNSSAANCTLFYPVSSVAYVGCLTVAATTQASCQDYPRTHVCSPLFVPTTSVGN